MSDQFNELGERLTTEIKAVNGAISLKVSSSDFNNTISGINQSLNGKADTSKLLSTGIDITKNTVTITADKFFVKNSKGSPIAIFTTASDGRPIIKADYVDVDSLMVKHLDGADGTFSGELKAAKGTFSGTISANGAKIGGFTIDKGSLYWKGRDFFGNDSRSIRIGVPTDANSGMIDINFNGATDGKFGVKVIGSNAGGACIYASRTGDSKPNISNTYAGYFDGGVHVNGNLYSNVMLSNEFGTGWTLQSNGTYTYKKGVTRTISWTIQNGSIPSRYSLVFENGILID